MLLTRGACLPSRTLSWLSWCLNVPWYCWNNSGTSSVSFYSVFRKNRNTFFILQLKLHLCKNGERHQASRFCLCRHDPVVQVANISSLGSRRCKTSVIWGDFLSLPHSPEWKIREILLVLLYQHIRFFWVVFGGFLVGFFVSFFFFFFLFFFFLPFFKASFLYKVLSSLDKALLELCSTIIYALVLHEPDKISGVLGGIQVICGSAQKCLSSTPLSWLH